MLEFKYPNASKDQIASYSRTYLGSDGARIFAIRSYEIDNKLQFEEMVEHLPKTASAILDIGCGPAVIDLFLARHYGTETVINIMDGSADTPFQPVGFRQQMIPWFDVGTGVALLKANLSNTINGFPADSNLTIPCDLIMSLKSWAHHYPIATYLGLAARSLSCNGRIILDLRTRHAESGIAEMLAAGYRATKIGEERIGNKHKCDRLIFQRA